MKTILFIATILFSSLGFSQNGIEMIMAHKQFKDNGVSIKDEKSSTIWITETRMKINSDDPSEPIMIYDATSQVITMVMKDKKQYTEISESEMKEVNAQLEESRKMMEQQLAQLPESQRAMVKEKMGAMFEQAAPQMKYEKSEEGVSVGPYSTTKYIGNSDGQNTEEVFIASLDQFNVNESYFSVFSNMMEFMKENMGKMMNTLSGQTDSGALSSTYPSMENGIPVKSTSFKAEVKTREEVLMKISEKEIPAEAFSVPAGFKKVDMMKKMKSGK